MGLYLDNGYLNIEYVVNLGTTFNYIVGGRGTGKTYSSLKYVTIEEPQNFILMRRIQKQCDLINKEEFNPFKKLNNNENRNFKMSSLGKDNAYIYDADDAKIRKDGTPEKSIGVTCALSTTASIRGIDASDKKMLIYDEFIKEPHEKPIKLEGFAFANAYETFNRNRELAPPAGNSEPPIKCLCLANSFDLANPIFQTIGLTNKAETMKRKGQSISVNKERDLSIILLEDSKISEEKAKTALYKMMKGTEYMDMAIMNKFIGSDDPLISSMNLNSFSPVAYVSGMCLYKHKSENIFYVSRHVSGSPRVYGSTRQEIERFKLNYAGLYMSYIRGRVKFENYDCMASFLNMLENKQ